MDPSVFDEPCITMDPPSEGKSLRSKVVLLLLVVPPGAMAPAPDADDVSFVTAELKPFPRELEPAKPPAPPSSRSDMPFEFCWLLLEAPNITS